MRACYLALCSKLLALGLIGVLLDDDAGFPQRRPVRLERRRCIVPLAIQRVNHDNFRRITCGTDEAGNDTGMFTVDSYDRAAVRCSPINPLARSGVAPYNHGIAFLYFRC